MTVIRMTTAHIPAVAALEAACFSAPWSEAALADTLLNPHAVFFVATEGDAVLGYAGLHHIGDEGYIDNIATAPAARRQGVGRALMAALDTYGRAHDLTRLTLEVRASNEAAISLYTAVGYVLDGIRPHFYSKPMEDAAIYSYYFRK